MVYLKLPQQVIVALAITLAAKSCVAFAPTKSFEISAFSTKQHVASNVVLNVLKSDDWNGEVVSNTPDGRIRGCSLTQVDGTLSQWIVSIDGQEADLGKFSEAIYRKITSDAKKQQFQGFRPGTIPPHLMGTYIGFAMDECAREATLEAMQQNNIRPFDDARLEMTFDTVSILQPPKKNKKKKNKKRGKNAAQISAEDIEAPTVVVEEGPQWLIFDTMKEAINGGWKPGQTFSFVARNVKGQQLNDQDVMTGAKAPSAADLNSIKFDGE
mmetsp:Transcript_5179/g.6683  ORF Transcript_5179/g.6683 Transcript_5179/m.6683 type:complete len:269 (+) Transcript_5179:100-906(+)